MNGLIQSGAETIELGISSDFVPPAYTTNFIDEDGVGLLQACRLELPACLLTAIGMLLIKRLLSMTFARRWAHHHRRSVAQHRNGRLKVANGYPSLNFDNDSPYQLVMNEIDTTKFREGVITVIDSGLLTKAEYKFLPATNQIQERRYTGQLVTGGNDNDGRTMDRFRRFSTPCNPPICMRLAAPCSTQYRRDCSTCGPKDSD